MAKNKRLLVPVFMLIKIAFLVITGTKRKKNNFFVL